MRILYITRMNYFANKSHVYTTSKTCEALNNIEGVECILLSTDDSLLINDNKINFFKSIGVLPFPVISIGSIGNFFRNSKWRIFNWFETFFINLSITKHILFNRNSFDILYFRDTTLFLPIFMSKYFFKKPLFMEAHAVMHSFLKRSLTNFIASKVDGIISISSGLKKYYDKINAVGIVLFCSASDPSQFEHVLTPKDVLRDKLNLQKDKIILGYAGNLSFTGNNDSYGLEDIIRALPILDNKIIFVGVGQKSVSETLHLEELAKELKVAERVVFLPRVSKNKIAEYLKSFDILVHPKAGAEIGNSPAKLFEWFLTGVPIVSANTQAISEILTDGIDSILVDHTNPKSWAIGITKVLDDKDLREKLIVGAKESSKKYTWDKRGLDIANFIRENTNIHE